MWYGLVEWAGCLIIVSLVGMAKDDGSSPLQDWLKILINTPLPKRADFISVQYLRSRIRRKLFHVRDDILRTRCLKLRFLSSSSLLTEDVLPMLPLLPLRSDGSPFNSNGDIPVSSISSNGPIACVISKVVLLTRDLSVLGPKR